MDEDKIYRCSVGLDEERKHSKDHPLWVNVDARPFITDRTHHMEYLKTPNGVSDIWIVDDRDGEIVLHFRDGKICADC